MLNKSCPHRKSPISISIKITFSLLLISNYFRKKDGITWSKYFRHVSAKVRTHLQPIRAQFSFKHIFPTLLPHHFCYLLIPNIGISKEQQIKAIATQTGNNQSKTCTNRVQIRCANLCGLSYLLRLIPPQHSNIVTFFFHILLKCLLLVPQCQWEWKGRVSNVAFGYSAFAMKTTKSAHFYAHDFFFFSLSQSLVLFPYIALATFKILT